MKAWLSGACARLFFSLGIVATSVDATAVGYFAQGGKIYDENAREIQVRGISHFGFNGTTLQPQYLWAMGWKQQIAQIKGLGFNAIRVPFVPDTLYNTTAIDKLSYIDPNLNADLVGKTPLQVLDLWMAEADRQGLYVLLDFHSVSMVRQYPTWFVSNAADFNLIYNKQAYTKEDWLRDLAFVARRYAHLPHFVGIDVYNEPNSSVRWSVGDPHVTNAAYYWKAAAESASAAVLAANPKLLIFVQGINGNFDGRENSNIPMNWGEDFQPQAYQPLAIPDDKLVLTPHTYGPDVYMKSSFTAPNFPANLPAQWDTLFGQFNQRYSIVIGEWGGKYGQGTSGHADVTWQNAFVDYLVSRGMRNSFYWSYTPNSGDTGGILDDNLNVREDKLALLKRLWGNTQPAKATPTSPLPADPTWVPGHGTNGGAVKTASDTQVKSPASTTSSATTTPSSPSKATLPPVQTTGSTGVYRQPSITAFAPKSGKVGTLVTLTGSGFAGAERAWVGAAKDAHIIVLSDTQVQITIPSGATSGAIGILNPQHAAFTPTAFEVTSTAPTYVQPQITSFAPRSGPVGTVVTVDGNGFSGATLAWIGPLRNVTVRVISDRQVQLTIPPGATTSAIGIFNPAHAAFTPAEFVVH